jgi:hypothetical protein
MTRLTLKEFIQDFTWDKLVAIAQLIIILALMVGGTLALTNGLFYRDGSQVIAGLLALMLCEMKLTRGIQR